MTVDTDHFPTATTISMVDARLPNDKGNGKAKFMPMQFIQKQSSRPQLKINLVSNEPPQDSIGPAIVESLSDSSKEETGRPIVLCSRCNANDISTEPKEKPLRVEKPQQTPITTMATQKALKCMQEFHKKYSANDLYSLQRACQDTLDLVLACLDVMRIIQKTLDPRMKARYQHIYSHIEDAHKQDTPLESPTHPERKHDPMAALGELFPRSSSIKLHHLKSLYVTAHIKGYMVSKIFVNYGATINIMLVSIMKALHRSNDEFIPSRVTMSSFIDDKFQTKGCIR
ncbi:hypothetical protein D8674_003693 [Pyrus ussuriensis x Pyrus communis]|uniref:Uncharacterized protein n=1 Tax=Pyrus ussuriensis x Pyrus communis TaxID=2448454 RepID=A0A5N5FHS2_9ROSA|nr:hypothetical protein D8674_003693 [Pyrus ussuriensis x Pyrus communis]